MARIELKNCNIYLEDGLTGTGGVDTAGAAAAATTIPLKSASTSVNFYPTDVIPVGARFTVGANDTIYTVQSKTPSDDATTTTSVVVTPAIPTGEDMTEDDVITFLPQRLTIKVGDGNLTYTENKNYEYELDRGALDTVKEGDEAPLDVNLSFVYEFITTGTGETITPMDALKGKGGASNWVKASDDVCEPHCVDVRIVYTPPCGGAEIEDTLFPEFRHDSAEVDFGEAQIAISGRCNALEPIITRYAQP